MTTTHYLDLDTKLATCRLEIEPYFEIEDKEVQQEIYRQGKEPDFTHFELSIEEFSEKLQELEALAIEGEGWEAELLRGIHHDLVLQYQLLLHRGTAICKELSRKLYGDVEEETISYAKELVKKELPAREKPQVVSSEVKEELERTYQRLGLQDWKVEYSRKEITQDDTPNKRILISKTRLFHPEDAKRLSVHEIGVHALRYVNGKNQVLSNMGYGLQGYLQTEEGLAAYMEEQEGVSNPYLMKNYAGRVLAVMHVQEGKSFRECMTYLEKYFSFQEAWTLAFRAYRAGGYMKDHVYLQGYLQVKDYLKENDVEFLYTAKFGIQDSALLKELLEKGIVKKPTYIWK